MYASAVVNGRRAKLKNMTHPLFSCWGVQGVDQETSGSTTWISQLIINDEDLPQSSHREDSSEPNENHEGNCLPGLIGLYISRCIACSAK